MPGRCELLIALMLVACGAGALPAYAGDDGVLVQVRVIKGSLPMEAGPLRKFEYDKRLEDLRPELARLRYGSFSLLASQKKVVRLSRRETIPLADGETLTIRPHYSDTQRVGMWLKWTEKNGASVLDTRLHLDCGKNILVEESRDAPVETAIYEKHEVSSEASSSPGSGMILAISVAPSAGEN